MYFRLINGSFSRNYISSLHLIYPIVQHFNTQCLVLWCVDGPKWLYCLSASIIITVLHAVSSCVYVYIWCMDPELEKKIIIFSFHVLVIGKSYILCLSLINNFTNTIYIGCIYRLYWIIDTQTAGNAQRWILSTIATDSLVLKHQTISTRSAD